jgi:flagellar basal body-associated protein FliL
MMFQPSPRSGKKIVILAIIVALVLVVGGAGAFLGPKLLKHHGKAEAADKTTADADKSKDGKDSADGKDGKDSKDAKGGKDGKGKAEEKGKDGKDGDKPEPIAIVPLGDFLVNLNSAGGGVRYLRAEVSVALKGLPMPKKEGEGKAPQATLPDAALAVAKDRVVSVLSAGDFAQLRLPGAREKLKLQVLARLEKALPDYEVTEVLFTSFVMQ